MAEMVKFVAYAPMYSRLFARSISWVARSATRCFLCLPALRGGLRRKQRACTHPTLFLAVNPMGKVPAIPLGDALVTEQVAIGIYLADLFPETGLAPAIGNALRGRYLRWYVCYAACFEPAMSGKWAVQAYEQRQAAALLASQTGRLKSVGRACAFLQNSPPGDYRPTPTSPPPP
jgi:hypothetical protein